jgi:hypothetical protein
MTEPKKDKAAKTAVQAGTPHFADHPAVTGVRCAQRGCLVPPEHANDKLCPVCNNPLNLIPASTK